MFPISITNGLCNKMNCKCTVFVLFMTLFVFVLFIFLNRSDLIRYTSFAEIVGILLENQWLFMYVFNKPLRDCCNYILGESELSGFVYIPGLDKVLKPFTVDQKVKAEAEIHCQTLNGTLFMITSLERQVYTEKLLRGRLVYIQYRMRYLLQLNIVA